GLHLGLVEVEHDRPQLAADDHGGGGALDLHDHVPHLAAAHVIQDLLRPGAAAHRDDGDGGGAGRVERQHHGRQGAGGQVGQGGRGEGVHVGGGAVGRDVVEEVVADDGGAEDGARLLPLHAVALASPALHAVGDVLFHAAGGHAAVKGEHLDCRALVDRQD